jgi:hypothetical protein
MSTHDPEFYQAPKYTPEPPPAVRKQHGCFFYGCIIAGILALLFVILMVVLGVVAYNAFNNAVQQYTSTTPLELPKVQMQDEQRTALKNRVEAFRKAVNEGRATETLVLTSDDINALIDEQPELKGTVYVKVEGDKVKGLVSFPLEKFANWSVVRGRYLNGEADVKASLEGGVLFVTLDSLEVNGKKVPEEVMKGIREQNMAKDMYKDEKSAEMLRKLEKLEIKDGKITLKIRARPGSEAGTPAPKKEAQVEIIPPPKKDAAQPAPSNDEPANPKSPAPPADAPAPKS